MQALLRTCNKLVIFIYIKLQARVTTLRQRKRISVQVFFSLQDYHEVRTMTLLIALFVVAWVAAALIGTQAYFRGEQTKPIHARNWRSDSFEKLAVAVTGVETDFGDRTPGFTADAYDSATLPTV
jgi:hypothetical protein